MSVPACAADEDAAVALDRLDGPEIDVVILFVRQVRVDVSERDDVEGVGALPLRIQQLHVRLVVDPASEQPGVVDAALDEIPVSGAAEGLERAPGGERAEA